MPQTIEATESYTCPGCNETYPGEPYYVEWCEGCTLQHRQDSGGLNPDGEVDC